MIYLVILSIILLVIFLVNNYNSKIKRYKHSLSGLLKKGNLTDEDEEILNDLSYSLGLSKSTTDKIRIDELSIYTQPIIDNIISTQSFSPEDERKLLTIAYNHRINATFEDAKFNIYRNYWARSQKPIMPSGNELNNCQDITYRTNDSIQSFCLPTVLDFIALDLETANENYSSICQLGLAVFYNGQIVYTWSSLINPECNFTNTSIHGISSKDTINSPKFVDIYHNIVQKLSGFIVIHHTHFDKTAIGQACQKYLLPNPNIRWLDSSRIARHTWSDVKNKGYGLSDLAKMFNIKFNHHDALEDARVAGIITIKAINDSGIIINDWVHKASNPLISDKPIDSPISNKAKRILKSKSNLSDSEINKLSDFEAWKIIYKYSNSSPRHNKYNQICFTGFNLNEREELELLAIQHGLEIVKSVTNHLQFLCIGDNAGPSKLEKAKKNNIIILTAIQFKTLLETGELPQ